MALYRNSPTDRHIFFDVETYIETKDTRPVACCNYSVGVTMVEMNDYDWPADLKKDWDTSNTVRDIRLQAKNNYRYFLGKHCDKEFVNWLTTELSKPGKIFIYAYNLTYDYHQILPLFKGLDLIVDIDAKTDDTATLVYVNMRVKTRSKNSRPKKVRFVDLWRWNKQKLESWLKEVSTQQQQVKKLKIDYGKRDMQFNTKGEPVAYYTDMGELKLFEATAEAEYQKEDVVSLPLIKTYIKGTAESGVKVTLGGYTTDAFKRGLERKYKATRNKYNYRLFTNLGGRDYLIVAANEVHKLVTLGSFSKFCGEMMSGFDYNDVYRFPISSDDYRMQRASFVGGFTSGNNEFDRITPEQGELIELYDVNSMYPDVMRGVLPFGEPLAIEEIPQSERHLYNIKWMVMEGTQYKWKEKYSTFDNEFLGKSFFEKKLMKMNQKLGGVWYLEESLWKLMQEMCDLIDVKQVGVIYQKGSSNMATFIQRLVKIKEDKTLEYKQLKKLNDLEGVETQPKEVLFPEIPTCKLMLNSQYGKMCEKARADSKVWDHEKWEYRNMTEDELQRLSYPCQLTGIFITSRSRAKLLRACKQIIDAGHFVLYCDTDSITVKVNKAATPINELIEIDNSRLGYWDKEIEGDTFLYIKKHKKYYIYNSKTGEKKFASSGFNKQLVKKLPLEDIFTLYDKNNNVIVERGKKVSAPLPGTVNQKVIYDTDIMFNPSAGEITHILFRNPATNEYTMREATESDRAAVKSGKILFKGLWV